MVSAFFGFAAMAGPEGLLVNVKGTVLLLVGLAGIVLCGGQSKRMGQPKAWLPFGGEFMLARVVRLLGQAHFHPPLRTGSAKPADQFRADPRRLRRCLGAPKGQCSRATCGEIGAALPNTQAQRQFSTHPAPNERADPIRWTA